MNQHDYRDCFHIPTYGKQEQIYFCGNSLGLQPKSSEEYVGKVLSQWRRKGVVAHFSEEDAWLQYPAKVIEKLRPWVGAMQDELVLMNALSVNIHLMLATFYKPTQSRFKILIEDHIFPSDKLAIISHCQHLGIEPAKAIIEIPSNQYVYDHKVINELIEQQGNQIALVFLAGVQYISGQVMDIAGITAIAKAQGCVVGWDFAHAVGNIALQCHEWNIDFAVWCHYKYMNAGPGAIGGCFIHQHHLKAKQPGLMGWWGQPQNERFALTSTLPSSIDAKSWQISNPAIVSLALLDASLDICNQAGVDWIVQRQNELWEYQYNQLMDVPGIQCITPPKQHGCQISLQIKDASQELLKSLYDNGVVADWRGQEILRFAPVPLYNTFTECEQFSTILTKVLNA